jgi:hypothetical protein
MHSASDYLRSLSSGIVLAGETIQLQPSCGVRLYRDARKAVKALIREPIEFETPDGSYAGMPLFSDMRYLQHKGLVSALFHDKAQPYLLQLEKQFTSWRLDQTIPLTTSYAVRHYMISKMVERRGRTNSHTFEMEDYRKKMAVEDKYDRFVDLRRRVLDPSMEQINSETDLTADYTVVRNGQTPVGLKFIVRPPEQPAKPKRQYIPDSPDVDEHDRWVTGLPQDEQKVVMKEAEERARANGYDKNGEDTHFWQMGVDVMLRQIYNRETGGDASVIVSDR